MPVLKLATVIGLVALSYRGRRFLQLIGQVVWVKLRSVLGLAARKPTHMSHLQHVFCLVAQHLFRIMTQEEYRRAMRLQAKLERWQVAKPVRQFVGQDVGPHKWISRSLPPQQLGSE